MCNDRLICIELSSLIVYMNVCKDKERNERTRTREKEQENILDMVVIGKYYTFNVSKRDIIDLHSRSRTGERQNRSIVCLACLTSEQHINVSSHMCSLVNH
jgi:hypothetical protein